MSSNKLLLRISHGSPGFWGSAQELDLVPRQPESYEHPQHVLVHDRRAAARFISPHFSPGFVARVRRLCRIKGFA